MCLVTVPTDVFNSYTGSDFKLILWYSTYMYDDNILHLFFLRLGFHFLGVIIKVFFSSPELKAQVSFSDRLSSGVCPSVRLSVCPSVNFSYFQLLLKNHWTNFNQTWHKVSLGEGDSSLFKCRAPPFSKGR